MSHESQIYPILYSTKTVCLTAEHSQLVQNGLNSSRQKTVVPLKQFQSLRRHTASSAAVARVAAYDTASVPASDSILRWAWHHHTHLVTQICCCTFCLTLCSTSRGPLELVSMICQCACCSQKRHIQNKLGHCMQRAHSLRTPPTALAPQLPQVAGSVKISAVDPGQACVSPGEQHNGSAIFYRQRNIHS